MRVASLLVDDVVLHRPRGEILGVAGVEGNGQTELIEAIIGHRSRSTAAPIVLGGEDLARVGTREAARARPRLHPPGPPAGRPGARPRRSGRTSCSATRPGRRSRRVRGSTSAAPSQRTREIIDEFDVRTPGPEVAALALSGGNQQKLIVGREMTAEPRVLIAAHPTRGVDVGAQADIWEDLREARAAGWRCCSSRPTSRS